MECVDEMDFVEAEALEFTVGLKNMVLSFFLSEETDREIKAEVASSLFGLVWLGCCRANERPADGWNVENAKDQRPKEIQ